MADVGRDTIVGAGAVVTRPLPDRVIAGGVPARVVRQREERETGRHVRVLFLTHRLPYAPNRGDRVRAYHIVRLLAPRVDLEIVRWCTTRRRPLRSAGSRPSARESRSSRCRAG